MTAVAAHDDGAKAKDVLDRSDARWLRLQEIIRAHSSQRRQSLSLNKVCSRRFYCYFLSKLPAPYDLHEWSPEWFNRKGA